MRGAFANGEQLQAARIRRGLTQEALASLAELDVKTVRKAERGKRLDINTLLRLARALETEPGRLIQSNRSEAELQVHLRNLVCRWLQTWDEQDRDALVALYHEAATMRLPGEPNIPFSGIFRGRVEIGRAHEVAWSTCQTEPAQYDNFSFAVSGNVVLFQGPKGVYLPNGEVVHLWCVQIFTFDGDLIIDHRVDYDTLQFVRLLEFPPPNGEAAGDSESSR